MNKNLTRLPASAFALIVLLLTLCHGNAYGQEAEAGVQIQNDSTAAPEIIPFNEVLIAAGESRVQTLQMSESLISKEEIQRENKRNDSILVLIDSALSQAKNVDYRQLSARALTNQKNYWESARKEIERQKKRLTERIRDLQDNQLTLEEDLQKWRNTQNQKDSAYAYGNISEAIVSTSRLLDSLAEEVEARTELLIAPLNQTISTEVALKLLMEKIEEAQRENNVQMYAKSSPSLFERGFSSTEGPGVLDRLKRSMQSEWRALVFYFGQYQTHFLLYLLFTAGVLGIFFWMKTRLKFLKADGLSYYEKTLKRVLRRPLSAGLLFCLFLTVAFFPNRPPLLIDMVMLALLFPLLDLTLILTPNTTHRYLWGFGILLLCLLGIQLLPVDSLLYRYGLLGLGALELLLLALLYRQRQLLELSNRTLTRFIRLLLAFHLLATGIGILANLFGYTRFSEIAIGSFIINALVGLLLFISLIILIGGLQFLISSRYMKRFDVIRAYEEYLKGLVSRIAIVGGTLFWLDALLRIFYLKEGVYAAIRDLFTRELSLGSMSFTLGKIVLFIFLIWFSIILSRVIKIVLRSDVLDKLPLKKGVPRMITAITQFALIALGVIMAVRAIGMPLDQLTIIFSAFSVGIGFGLQNIFNNLVSGVILLFEREVQIGDIIEVGTLMGKVKSMGIRSSHIQTFDGAEVIVPNGQLISQEVVDWTLSDKSRRIEIISGVAYGSDVHRVKELLMQVILDHPEVSKTPEPMVLFNAMGESSLDFRLLFWTDQFDEWLRIRSEVIFAIHDILYANNISIPFPQRDLHLKTMDPTVFKNQGSGKSGPPDPD